MEEKAGAEFKPDAYLEHLLILRESDPFRFDVLPEAVKRVIAQYEREKEVAELESCRAKPDGKGRNLRTLWL